MKTIIILEPEMKANLIRILNEDIHQHDYAREKIDVRLMEDGVPEQEEDLLVEMHKLHGDRMNNAALILDRIQNTLVVQVNGVAS